MVLIVFLIYFLVSNRIEIFVWFQLSLYISSITVVTVASTVPQ